MRKRGLWSIGLSFATVHILVRQAGEMTTSSQVLFLQRKAKHISSQRERFVGEVVAGEVALRMSGHEPERQLQVQMLGDVSCFISAAHQSHSAGDK
jgi:hypothetical protein